MECMAIEMDDIDPISDWIIEHGGGPEDPDSLVSEEELM